MKFIDANIHWGIIGCGDVCEVKSGPAFSKINDSKLAAVMRRNVAKAKDYAQRHGVSKYYSDGQQLIDDPEVNAIYVATPPAQHEEYALQAMKAGKPVYIEKPIALDAASCERMMDAEKKYQVPVSGAYYRRALPLFKKVKSILQENGIGKVRLVTINTFQSKNTIESPEENWRINPSLSGGGLFHDLAPHQLDLMYWFFGEPKEINARSMNQEKKYQAPDFTGIEAVFDNDIFFRGEWLFHMHESAEADTCEIIGNAGMLRFSFFKESTLEVVTNKGAERIEFTNPIHIQQPLIEQVVSYFKGKGKNPCSLADALVSMKILDRSLAK